MIRFIFISIAAYFSANFAIAATGNMIPFQLVGVGWVAFLFVFFFLYMKLWK